MRNKMISIVLTGMMLLQLFSPALVYAQEMSQQSNNLTTMEETSLEEFSSETESSSGQIESSSTVTSTERLETKISDVPIENKLTTALPPTIEPPKNEQNTRVSRTEPLSIMDNIFTSVKLYKINGDEIQKTDTIPNMSGIKVSLMFSFTNKNYQAGDTFTTQLPLQIAIAKNLSGDFSPMTSAKWTIDAATKKLTITFLEDNVISEEYKLNLITSLEKVNSVDEELQQIIFTTTPTETAYTLETTSSVKKGKSTTTVSMETINPKNATITSVFNLDRTDLDNRLFKVEAYNYTSKLSYEGLSLYRSAVDFNGELSGTKTLLEEGTDYQVIKKGTGTNQAAVEITMVNKLGKQAIIVESKVTGVDGQAYIEENGSANQYNYFYANSYVYENGTNIDSSYQTYNFVAVQPLEASGKINKETGYIDWTIQYNFNERPLTDGSKLTTSLAEQGVKYVEDSLTVEKIGLQYKDGFEYTVVNEGDGSSDWQRVPETDNSGLGELFYKGQSNQAYIVKYSTKIIDPTERIIENIVSDGKNVKEVKVSLIPNLLHKESGQIDVYNRSMEWTITVNAEKYTMKEPVVHDYFIGSVFDYSSLKVKKKISETMFESLIENVDYKVTKFDESGSPVSVQPNVNGAPSHFNGGVRIDFLGNYKDLKDTLVITITTKLNTSKEKTEILNKATLNYGDTPGVIEYEAKGEFIDPYYTGGAKLGEATTSDNQYLYQNWLILANAKGSNFSMTSVQDALPIGSELVPGSLRFEEVTSQEMLNNMRTYLQYDYSLVPQGADAYPSKINTDNNKINLEFANLGSKRVYIKYRTRVKKSWYKFEQLKNTAEVTYDDNTIKYNAELYVTNFEKAVIKSGALDKTKENVANWTITTRSISKALPVANPVISDSINSESVNATYDPISFVIKNVATGERISSEKYQINIKGNAFEISFSDYIAEENIQVTYNTINEFPGLIKSTTTVSSASYENLSLHYRQGEANVHLNFTSSSGSGIMKTANLDVIKVDSLDETITLENASFEILKADGAETGLKGETDDRGRIKFSGIPLGEYRLKEIKAPTGYEVNSEYQEGKLFTLTENMAPIMVKNKKIFYSSVVLQKIDVDSQQPLEAAVFQLQKIDGTTVSSGHTTDSNGQIILSDLTVGDYQFIETKAPDGYQLDSTPLEFSIVEGQAAATKVSMTNKQTPGDVILKKIDKKNSKALPNAVFELRKADGEVISGGHMTDVSGTLNISGLAPGSYQFVETQAPVGYKLVSTPISFEIKKGQTKATEVEVMNEQLNGSVILTKTDKKTGKLLPEAIFELQKTDGSKVLEQFSTDENGKLTISGLEAGEYQFVEREAPKGYKQDSTPIPFTIKENQTEAVEVSVTNEQILGGIIVTKIDELTGKSLPKATFKLLDKNNKPIIESIATDDFGKFAIEDLPEGEYQLIEIEAPEGYILDSKPHNFEIIKSTTINTKITNMPKKQTVTLTKIDKQSGEKLAGAVFKLLNSKEELVKGELTTGELGTIVVENLPNDTYRFVETKAPKGYQKDVTPVEFKMENNRMLSVTKTNEKTLITKITDKLLPKTGKALTTNSPVPNTENTARKTLPNTGEKESFLQFVLVGVIILLAIQIVCFKRTDNLY